MLKTDKIKIGFGSQTEKQLYKIEYGSIGPAKEKSGNSLIGEHVEDGGYHRYLSSLYVRTSGIETIERVQFDYNVKRTPCGITIRVKALDENYTVLETLQDDGWVDTTCGDTAWHTVTYSDLSIQGASYVHIYIGIGNSNENVLDYVELDSVRIEGDGRKTKQDGAGSCPTTYAGKVLVNTPIALQDGEKQEHVTDFMVNSPVGQLAFTRSYRQYKHGEFNDVMGLGWSHNHNIKIEDSISGKLLVYLDKGTIAHFAQEGITDIYKGELGSTAEIDAGGSGTSKYTLTTQDGSKWVFDDQKRLRTRTFPNGEILTYVYILGGFADGKLQDVSDAYGNKLQFSYIDNSNNYNDLQIWRVGDKDATGLDGGSPSGQYIEFTYVDEKDDGSSISGAKALLSEVKDVRGHTWEYDYYGQESDESNDPLLNFLTEINSPSVDIDGDNSPDGTLTLKRLSYAYTSELAINGDMELDSDWDDIVGNEPTTNEQSTTQVDEGTYSRHVDADAAGEGIEGNIWHLIAGREYAITAQVYPVSGTVKMQVSGEGAFDDTSSGTGGWEELSGTYIPTEDTDDQRLQFIASGGSAEFYVDSISIQETYTVREALAVNGDMELDSDWDDISGNEPTTNERSTTQVDEGTYSRHVDAAIDEGIEGNQWSLLAGHEYTITARVYPVTGTVKMQVDNESAFDDSSTGTGAWETLTTTYTMPRNQTIHGNKLQFIASGGASEFYVDDVSIEEVGTHITRMTQELGVDGSEILKTVDYTFQPNGENLTTETAAGKTTHHRFVGGVYLGAQDPGFNGSVQGVDENLRPVSQEDPNGNETQLSWSSDAKQLNQVTDALDNTTQFSYHTDGTLKQSVDAEGRKTTYIYNPDLPQPTLILVSEGDATEIDIDGDMETVATWSAVTSATQNQSTSEIDSGDNSWYVDAADGDGIESASFSLVANKTYAISARVYPVNNGDVVKMKISGVSDPEATSIGYGTWESLRLVYTPTTSATKTLQFLADGGAAEFYVDSVHLVELAPQEIDLNGDMEDNSGWSAIDAATANQSTTQVNSGTYSWYVDAVQDDGIKSVTWAMKPNHGYLISARVYPVSGADTVKMSVSDITTFDVSSQGDSAWETLQVIHRSSSGGIKTLQFLADGGAAEFYVDNVHVIELPLLRWQDFSYDNKGRTISEATVNVDTASPIQQTTRSYYTTGNGNGLLETLTQVDVENPGSGTSTTYTYDSAGRVVKTNKASLFGTCQYSYTVYDEAGNVTATVCSLHSYTIPTTVAEAEALYDANDSQKKHNRVTTHTYDEMGRRVSTTTNAGMDIEQTSLTFYDSLNRVTRTISNYVNQSSGSAEKPALWVWSDTNDRWEKSASDTTEILHGDENTENVISDTEYNDRGMVRLQRDALGNVTLMGYDDAGRVVKTVRSAATPDYNNNYSGTSPDPDLSAYSASSTVDKDAITEQVYDPAGNLVKTIDPLGNVNFTVYDALNRPVKTVQAAGTPSYDILSDLDLSAYTYSTAPDKDAVSETEYDAMGRVIRSKRLLENRGVSEVWDTTLFGYDTQGRQIKVIRHAATPAYNIASDPDLSAYSASSDADKDIISTTIYDSEGRATPLDVDGNQPYSVYDSLGRQIRTIANYVLQGSSDPADWEWDTTQWEDGSNNAIAFGDNNDENIISETIYDGDGRVFKTRDILGRVTYMVYDAQGRQVRTIQNYVPQFDSVPTEITPDDWVWDDNDNQWEQGSGFTPTTAIARGTNYDQNIVTETVYDDMGRVQQTIDARRNVTYTVYGESNRTRLSISNYVEQGSSDPDDWVWENNQWEDGSSNAISFGSNYDQNRISESTYDLLGRVIQTRDTNGIISVPEYDDLGRRVKSTSNLVNGTYNPSIPDQDIISQTEYNVAGQVVKTIDARGTETTFTYDTLGRRLTVTAATNSHRAVTSYTCYDKGGRVLRTIQNYVNETAVSPDTQTASAWDFDPSSHGVSNDENLITEFTYDNAGRKLTVTNPAGDVNETAYFKNGQVRSITQKDVNVNGSLADVETHYRYDKLRRRNLVVQNYISNGEEPELWVWDTNQFEESDGTAIAHGSDNDQNIIVQVAHDVVGRMISMRNPRGKETTYTYDNLNRRLSLTNPLSKVWSTAYADLSTGGTRTTMTYPGINGGGSYNVQRDFDPMGRLISIGYNDPANTPDVDFTYDLMGNRTKMIEYDNASHVDANRIRETSFSYDDLSRLTSVEFAQNTTGDGSTLESVEQVDYEYDAGGLRTKMTLPGSLDIIYDYDERGRLVKMTDWDGNYADFIHDGAGRHVVTQRSNAFNTAYRYDTAGRLNRIRHLAGTAIRSQFQYEVDARGNRTKAFELLPAPTSVSATYDKDHANVSYTEGTWSNNGSLKESTDFDAKAEVDFTGNEILLTFGLGDDHSIFDVYINGSLWQSYDGYASSTGEKTVHISLESGSHTLELVNRHEQNSTSTGYRIQFKQLQVLSTSYSENEIEYTYDAISRLLEADYVGVTRNYKYEYDLAGNRTEETIDNGTSTTFTYNDANQLTGDGTNTFTYDNNGNLQGDGTNTYTWDRANRQLTAPGNTSYAYDGLGNRIQKTVSSVVTDYLLDIQPGLTKVLAQTMSGNTDRFVHGRRGIHAMEDNSGDWSYLMQDGLGSVRAEVNANNAVLAMQNYAPYGDPFGVSGTFGGDFGFTGEQTDGNGQTYLRARYYNPGMGIFTALDPFEGVHNRPMSLNGYSWVEGNPVMNTDPSGLCSKRQLNEALPDNQIGRAERQRCQIQVNSLRVNFLITLTQTANLTFEDVWTTTRVQEVYDAVLAISASPITFQTTFGGVSLTIWENNEPARQYCATTPGQDNISWYNCGSMYDDPYSSDNIIHEFGHILQNRAGRYNGFSMPGTWDRIEDRSDFQADIIREPGLGFANPDLRQNARAQVLDADDRWAEEVADMFLFWVRGYGFSTASGIDGQIGDLRRAFVNGETLDFSDANGGPIENLGIIGWSMRASQANESAMQDPGNTLVGYPLINTNDLCIDIPLPPIS